MELKEDGIESVQDRLSLQRVLCAAYPKLRANSSLFPNRGKRYHLVVHNQIVMDQFNLCYRCDIVHFGLLHVSKMALLILYVSFHKPTVSHFYETVVRSVVI